MQISELAVLHQNYINAISSRKSLPREFDEALHTLTYLLDQVSKDPIKKLAISTLRSHPIRSLFVRGKEDPNSTKIRTKSKGAIDKEYYDLIWVLQALFDDQQRMLCGLPSLVDEFERLVQSDRKQKEMITPWVVQAFSDLAIMAKTRQQLNVFHPSGSIINNDSQELVDGYREPFSPYEDFRRKFEAMPEGLMADKGDPSDRKFYYPSEKRRTLQTTQDMQRAEEHLDSFWQTVDQHVVDTTGKSLHRALKGFFVADRQKQRTPDWIEPSKRPDKTETSNSVMEEPYIPSSVFISDLEARSGRKFVSQTTLPTRAKVKTRGTAQSEETEVSAPEQLERYQSDSQPLFAVSKRALKVFSILFPNPEQSDVPGEVAWTDF